MAAKLAEFLHREELGQASSRAEQHRLEALSIGQQLDNPWVLSIAFLTVASSAVYLEAFDRAEQAYEQALAAAQRIDILWLGGMTLYNLSYVTYRQGKFAQARQYGFESRLVLRRIGARRWEAQLLCLLGHIFRMEREVEQAVAYYLESSALFEQSGDSHNMYWAACNLGHALLHQDHPASASSHFRYSLAGKKEAYLAGMALAGIAGLLSAQQQPERATWLAGAAAACFSSTPRTLEPVHAQDWERIVTEIKEQLDEQTFAAAWQCGQILSLEEAITLAMECVPEAEPHW
jgi:tetratricopeptide (TPR) repeat protein